MNRIGKLFLIASLLMIPIAMTGCPAEEDIGGATTPVTKKSPTPKPDTGLGGTIG